MDNYTSLELSKKLKKAKCEWCNMKSEMIWYEGKLLNAKEQRRHRNNNFFDGLNNRIAPAYDILNDICVKYAKEFFGEELVNKEFFYFDDEGEQFEMTEFDFLLNGIVCLLQQGKKQEAEARIWKNCKFNPKNQ